LFLFLFIIYLSVLLSISIPWKNMTTYQSMMTRLWDDIKHILLI